MALAVPLSRFTSRVGGGSAFFVRRHAHSMKTHHILIIGASLLAAGCSQPASTTDARQAADMQTITNVIIKNGPIFKKAEAGQLGSQISIPIVIGTNSDQRHYIATWKDSTWQISPTNQ